MAGELTAETRALMWVFDRLSVDGGMTPREQRDTYREIGRVLLGKPSKASSYEPNEWDDSYAGRTALEDKP